MKKLAVSSFVSLFILSCAVSAPNNLSKKEDFSALAAKYNFSDIEREYKSFSTKALSHVYVKRMFGKYLGGTPNSIQLKRQLEFSRYLKVKGDNSYETSLKDMFVQTPTLYDQMTAIPTIQAKITNESGGFGSFVVSLAPYSTVPLASTATSITSTSFTANWTPVTGATSYILILDGVEITGITGTSHSVTGLQYGTSHTYKVKAINSGIPGNESNEISVVTVPASPTANAASDITTTSFSANWGSVTGATEYKLYIDNVLAYTGTNLTYSKTGLERGSEHNYYVKAVNATGDSSNSNTINLTTPGFTTLTEIQSIGTNGVYNFEHFTIGTDTYLAIANSNNGTSLDIDSKIYKWNTGTNQFDLFQSIPTHEAHDWVFFTIGTDYYLTVTNHSYGGNYNTDSKVYKFNSGTNQFVEYQSILTHAARNLIHFVMGTDHYLAIANEKGVSYNVDSNIYKWNTITNQFDLFQSVASKGGYDWEYFTIGAESYIALANRYCDTLNVDSKILKWNSGTNQFVEIQAIPTNGAVNWESFTIRTDHYLAVTNSYNGSSYNIDSKIYKWNSGTNQFVEIQAIPTNGAVNWEFFTIGTDNYLTVANVYNGTLYNTDSKIYKWNGTQFVEYKSIGTNGAIDWKFLTIGTNHYLAIANYNDGTSKNINSKIYRLD